MRLYGYGPLCQKSRNRRSCLFKKAADLNKDQTYFLSQLNEEQIASCLFPLGDIDKPEVRRIAEELALPIAHKKIQPVFALLVNDILNNFYKTIFLLNQAILWILIRKKCSENMMEFYIIP